MIDCVLNINSGKWIKFKKTEVFCHKCFQIFSKTFVARYSHEIYYPNGQKTHLFIVKKLICPKCEEVFDGVEFYHGANNTKTALKMAMDIY